MIKQKSVSTVRATMIGMAVNILLAVLKLILWAATGSGAMLSDALHSIADIFGDIVALIGVRTAAKGCDARYQYGRARYESLTAMMLSVMLIATGLLIGKSSAVSIITGGYMKLARPESAAVIAAAVPIIIKEQTYQFMRIAAIRNRSDALLAQAKHHRTDALSCLGGLTGMLGVYLGAPVIDSIAGLTICVLIIITAVRILAGSVRKLTDESCDDDTRRTICAIILSQPDVISISALRTRVSGRDICVEAEVTLPGNMTVARAREISDKVRAAIEEGEDSVKHCVVCAVPEG